MLDKLEAWMDERCKQGGSLPVKAGYLNYTQWCDQKGYKPLSKRAWSQALEQHGITSYRPRNNSYKLGISQLSNC